MFRILAEVVRFPQARKLRLAAAATVVSSYRAKEAVSTDRQSHTPCVVGNLPEDMNEATMKTHTA